MKKFLLVGIALVSGAVSIPASAERTACKGPLPLLETTRCLDTDYLAGGSTIPPKSEAELIPVGGSTIPPVRPRGL